jgi:hypothetical protein
MLLYFGERKAAVGNACLVVYVYDMVFLSSARNIQNSDLANNACGYSVYSETDFTFPVLSENDLHLIEDKHLPFSVCFVRLCEVFLSRC